MNLRELIERLDRLQHARGFKIAASITVLVLAIAAIATTAILTTGAESGVTSAWAELPDDIAPEQRELLERNRELILAATGERGPIVVVSVIAGALAIKWLIVIWLGLTLTASLLYVLTGLCLLVGVVYPPAMPYAASGAGVCLLTAAFVALLQGARALYSYENPVLTIARNVLAEAVRLRISLVLIILFVVLLAALPMIMNDEQPLRFRVQAFLQWATGLSFWIIAVLVLLFSVATVTFEQRDKIIWQTMTKPVGAWQYVLGKWLGVSTLAAILLAVSATGVFAFTEGLRQQRAVGEIAPFDSGDPSGIPTDDRRLLQSQVLVARRAMPPQSAFQVFDINMQELIEGRIRAERRERNSPGWVPTPRDLNEMRNEIEQQVSLAYQSIEPGEYEDYLFTGLSDAAERADLLTFRYKIDAEGNRPDRFYQLSFVFNNAAEFPNRTTGLGYSHTLNLGPDVISADGRLAVRVFNGAVGTMNGRPAIQPNPRTITFPSDGLEISYVVGGYEANFVRVVAVLWVKLAFLAAVGVWAGTFLSFPVASLVSMGIFCMAEGAGFISKSMETFGTKDHDGNTEYWRVISGTVANQVAGLFSVYADLRPTTRLADGILLGWRDVAQGTLVLGLLTIVLYALAVFFFRRRELAIYSGN